MDHREFARNIIALQKMTGSTPTALSRVFDQADGQDNFDFFKLFLEAVHLKMIRRSMTVGELLGAFSYADGIIERCKEENIQILHPFSDTFPKSLSFSHGPVILYARGDLSLLDAEKKAAVIGTRYPDEEGRRFAEKSGRYLAQNDYVVISGLAIGCDRAAHEGCLDEGGKTVAFVPSNISTIYPRQNAQLAERILEGGGLIVSMYSPGEVQTAQMYLDRDQLQASASDFIITSEFDANSGTLQTLKYAHEFHKPIYTLDHLTKNESFTGLREARKMGITIHALSMEEMRALISGIK